MKKFLYWLVTKLQSIIDNTEDSTDPEEFIKELFKNQALSDEEFGTLIDCVSDIKDGIGLVSTRVMLCAAHQAHTVLRIIAEEYEV